jgi:hypothetical protein
MRTPHRNPRPTRRPRPRALPPGWLPAVLALAPLLLASCTDQVAATCPALEHPEVLTVAAAAGDPCGARKGESAALLALRAVRTYQRSSPLAAGLPTRFPLRCGNARGGYLHLLDALAKGQQDHGDPVNDATFDAQIANTVDQGVPFDQGNNNWRLTVRYNDVQSACHSGDWGFRVVVATNSPPFPPPSWRRDELPVGVITAFRLPKGPPSVNFP